MKKKTVSGFIVLVILILVVLGVSFINIKFPGNSVSFRSNSSNYSTSIDSKDIATDYDAKAARAYKKQYIAALYIEGTIQEESEYYNQQWLLSTVKTLKNDKNNVALAIFINSPGGAVYQADEAYLA